MGTFDEFLQFVCQIALQLFGDPEELESCDDIVRRFGQLAYDTYGPHAQSRVEHLLTELHHLTQATVASAQNGLSTRELMTLWDSTIDQAISCLSNLEPDDWSAIDVTDRLQAMQHCLLVFVDEQSDMAWDMYQNSVRTFGVLLAQGLFNPFVEWPY